MGCRARQDRHEASIKGICPNASIISLVLGLAALGSLGADDAARARRSMPPELAHLPELLGDAEQLVDRVRDFDVTQQALAAWDLETAEGLAAPFAAVKQQHATRRYALVRRAYEFALAHFPGNARACNYYGELLYDRFQETERAVQVWEQASAADPGLGSPFNNLAIHYCHEGEYARGLKCYQRALEIEPDNPDYLFNLAQTCLVHRPHMQSLLGCSAPGLYEQAMELSRKAAENAPEDYRLREDYALNFFVAAGFGVKANWRAAAKAWQHARKHAPDQVKLFSTWLNEARVWIRQGNRRKARRCLERALEIRPQSVVARDLLDALQAK